MEILFLTRTAGIYKSAGLPNASGTFVASTYKGSSSIAQSVSGAFSGSYSFSMSYANAGSVKNTWGEIAMSLKNSNSIYGNSDTVQPPALKVRYYIKF